MRYICLANAFLGKHLKLGFRDVMGQYDPQQSPDFAATNESPVQEFETPSLKISIPELGIRRSIITGHGILDVILAVSRFKKMHALACARICSYSCAITIARCVACDVVKRTSRAQEPHDLDARCALYPISPLQRALFTLLKSDSTILLDTLKKGPRLQPSHYASR